MAHLHQSFPPIQLSLRTLCFFLVVIPLGFCPPPAESQITRPELVVQSGHTAVLLTSVAISRDGDSIASGSSDGRVRVWKIAKETPENAATTPTLVRIIGSGYEPVSALALTADAQYVAFVSGKMLTIAEVRSGVEIAGVPIASQSDGNVAFSPNRQWLAWSDGLDIRCWKLPQDATLWHEGPRPDAIQTLPAFDVKSRPGFYQLGVSALAFSHDSRWVTAGYSQGSAAVWNLASPDNNHRLMDEPGPVTSISFAADGTMLATASANYVSLWKTDSTTPFRTIPHRNLVWSVDFVSADSIASISADEVGTTLHESTWEVKTGRMTASASTEMGMFIFGFELSSRWAVAFSETADFLVFASDPKTLKTWHFLKDKRPRDVASLAPQDEAKLGGTTVGVGSVAADPNQHWLAIGSGRDIELWDLLTGQHFLIPTGYKKPVQYLGFNRGGTLLTSSTDEAQIDVWDVATRQRVKGFRGSYGERALGNGELIAIAAPNGTLRLFDTRTGAESVRQMEPFREVLRMSINQDASFIAAASQLFSTVQVWSSSGGHALQTVHTPVYGNSDLQFSADNKYLAWGTFDGHIIVLDIGTGQQLQLCCHARWAGALAFSRDDRLLFTGGLDQQIRVWDLAKPWQASKKETAKLSGHTGEIHSVAVAPGGNILISGSNDGTVRLWDLERKTELVDLIAMAERPLWLVVTPEGLFDGPARSIQAVSWRLPGTNDVFPLDSFYNDYFYPNLAPQVFAGDHPVPCMDIAALLRIPGAQTMRQQRQLHTELEDGHAVLCLPDRPVRQLFDGLDARVKGLPAAIDVDGFHRGTSPTCRFALNLPGTPTETEINTRLSPVALSCRTMPVANSSDSCKSKTGASAKRPVLHVQTIAIGTYASPVYPSLTNAVKDAKAVEDFFKNTGLHPGEDYDQIEVWSGLYDPAANLRAIQQRLKDMVGQVRPEDSVLLFLTGHGTVPPGQEMFYFITEDTKPEAEFDTAFSTAMLADFVRQLRAERVIIMINTCQSGGALDSLAKIISMKAAVQEPGSSAGLMGTHVLAAAIPFQVATAPNGDDPFTQALLTYLNNPLGNLPRAVCARDLASYVADYVKTKLNDEGLFQTPLRLSHGSNFLILTK
jgi:WD40 repeat protein